MKYYKYLKYVVKHKWYVMIECFKMKLFWQGITHDLSKFLPSEFFPYANFFYGSEKNPRNDTGYYDPINANNLSFEHAWHKHLHRNKHHWQWWIRNNDDGQVAVFEMPIEYLLEMVCDWIGAGKAQGFKSPKHDKYYETRNWYLKNKDKMQLASVSRSHIESILEIKAP